MIKTERLTIRELTAADWQGMQAIAADFRESKYAIYDMPLPVEETAIRMLTEQFAATGLFFAVLRRDCGEMIGYVCFHETGPELDLGYCFHSRHQGMGYAYESCRALMEEMEKRRGVKGFTAGTALENIPSRRLLERLGFTLIGTERLSFREGMDFEGGIFVRRPRGALGCSVYEMQ